jgi:hypothetical protein
MVAIDDGAADAIGAVLAELEGLGIEEDVLFENFTDPELCGNAIGIYSSINHRFWERSETGELLPLYYSVGGESVKGSSFLDRSVRSMVESNPEFFRSENLADFTLDKFHQLFGDGIFPDEDERYAIAKDFIDRTIGARGKSLDAIWREDAGETIEGFHGILDETLGFHDELCKKSEMFVKFMYYQGIWKAKDSENIVPPLDYHLMNISIKAGLIKINDAKLLAKLINREPLTPKENHLIRINSIAAYDRLENKFNVNPYHLDDVVWAESRGHCQSTAPTCGECVFDGACAESRNKTDLSRSFPVVYTNAF